MSEEEQIEILLRYLQRGRDSLLWKLEGLPPYDARRPMTPTGTNLLGLVKHVASVENGYLSESFGGGRAFPMPWFDSEEANADMWATADESVEDIVALYRLAWEADDASVRERGLDAVGTVPWWGEQGREVTMFRLLVHVIDETSRHAGHADILRESIDGAAGSRPGSSDLPPLESGTWAGYVEMLEKVAREA